jgi:hypothetical protein
MEPGAVVDLRSWMGRWRYQPEQDFVKLERIAPAQHHGMAATGHLEDLYAHVDERYVRETWGGGTYRVHAYQAQNGHPYLVDNGTFTVAGAPVAFPGPSGEPIMFPAGVAESSHYAPAGHRGKLYQQGNGGGVPAGERDGPFGDDGVLGLINRMQSQAEGRNQIELLERFKEQWSEASQLQAASADKAREEQDKLYGQLFTLQGQQSAPLQEALNHARAELEAIRNEYHRRIESRDAQQQRQLEQMRESQSQSIELLQKEHEQASQAATAANGAVTVAMREDRQRESTALREQHRAEVDTLRRELDNLRGGGQQRERDIREGYERELRDIRERLEERCRTVEQNADRSRTEHYAEVQRLREEYRERDTALRSEADQRITSLRTDLTTQHGFTRDSTVKTYEAQLDMLRHQLEEGRRREQERVETERTSSRTLYEPRIDLLNDTVQNLRADLQNTRAEAANATARASERQNPLNTIREAAGLHQAVGQLFGLPGTAGPEPVPKSLLGQLARYAPTISEHIVKPVVTPIREAVDIARQEAQERRAQLAEPIPVMQDPMGVPPPPEMHHHPQPQRRVHREPPPMSDDMLYDPVPPTPPVPETDTVSPPPSGASPGIKDAISGDVISYLAGGLDEGKMPQDVATEFKMMSGTGIIDPKYLDAITSTSMDTAVLSFVDAAQSHGAHDLTTPNGQLYLQAVYEALKQG